MFADQDDVWCKNKLTCMVEFFEKNCSNEIPTLVYADMTLIDGEGKRIGGTIGSKTKNGFKNKKSYYFSHNVYGCNLIMNKKLFKLPPDVDIQNKKELILSHDNYYAKSAALNGEIFYINTPLMNYRRHGGNVTAALKYDFGLRRITARMKNIGVLAKDHAYTYSQTLLFIKKYQEHGVSEEQELLLNKIERTIRRGGMSAALYLINAHISWGNRVKTISHFGIMLLGIYKKYLLV